MKTKTHLILGLSALAASLSFTPHASAATIAIVDSGTDVDHPALRNKLWHNPTDIEDAVDNDDNGYIDDVYGWDFTEGNWKFLPKRRLQGKFPQDVFNFFNVQTKYLTGHGSKDDMKNLKSSIKRLETVWWLNTFGNYIHGTHVAGIASKDTSLAELMVLKILPTETPKQFGDLPKQIEAAKKQEKHWYKFQEKILKIALAKLADQQKAQLEPVGDYLGSFEPQVANGSFGSSFPMMKKALKPIIELVLRSGLSDEKLNEFVTFFMDRMMESTEEALIQPAARTLFVFAAGNDGMDNDVYPTSPTNIKRHNTISVAATMGRLALAPFSNYGATMVEVAAPGVAIESTIPGNGMFKISGTSQAAPYVTNIVGRAFDANPSLSGEQVKYLVMQTVDVKDFLKGKVLTSGIVNPHRAVYAAVLSKSMPLDYAISKAKMEIPDVQDTTNMIVAPYLFEKDAQKNASSHSAETATVSSISEIVMPLPNFF